jgi:hypothetical protein
MPFAISVVHDGGPLDEINSSEVAGAGSGPGRVGREVRNLYPASGREARRVGTQGNGAVDGGCDGEILVVAGSHL